MICVYLKVAPKPKGSVAKTILKETKSALTVYGATRVIAKGSIKKALASQAAARGRAGGRAFFKTLLRERPPPYDAWLAVAEKWESKIARLPRTEFHEAIRAEWARALMFFVSPDHNRPTLVFRTLYPCVWFNCCTNIRTTIGVPLL
jgi:hypothetical protein